MNSTEQQELKDALLVKIIDWAQRHNKKDVRKLTKKEILEALRSKL
jgi:hypothetical protein